MKFHPKLLLSLVSVFSLDAVAVADTKDKDKKTAKEKEEVATGPQFAFVCLNDLELASEEEWKKSLTKWLDLKSDDQIKEFEMEVEEKKGKGASTVSFDVGENAFVVGMMEAPIPKKDIEYACMNSFLWPKAGKVMAKHKSHMIVMCLGEYDSACAKALALSRVIAATSECHNTAGIYWGHADIVHSPDAFRKMIDGASEKMEDIPTLAWVGFLREPGKKEGTVNFYTSGLSEFGAKEVEIINSKKKPSEIMELLGGLSTYLLVKGDVVKDGDTVGGTEEEKIKSKWADSHIGREGKVIRIDY